MESNQIKKTPTRRCTGCGEHFPKNTLCRIVRCPNGQIQLDLTGKLSGRGAYICKSATCLKKARRGMRIEKALECSVSAEIWQSIEEALG